MLAVAAHPWARGWGVSAIAIEYHRGMKFYVMSLGVGWWRWAIDPSESFKGFETKSGELFGTRRDAIEAAKREIERQGWHRLKLGDANFAIAWPRTVKRSGPQG